MKKTNIRSILKEVVTSTPIEEVTDFNTGVRIKELESFLSKWLVPVLEKGVGRDLIKVGFKDMLVKEINGRLNSQEVDESALSPGYLTNIYSDDQRLEATVYKDGVVSITVRDDKGNMKKSTAAVPLAQLQDSIEKLGTGLDTVKVNNFVEKVMNNEKVKSIINV